MHLAHFNFPANHQTKKRQHSTKGFDTFVVGLSFVYPLTGVPQAIDVWRGNGQASLITWGLLLIFGFVFLTYGIIHRVWPMIINNVIWTFIDLAIIIGVLQK